MHHRIRTRWRQSLAYGAALFAVGVAYRATFIPQGYNATDEGWLQSLGARIVSGQLPYRDFNFGLPPVSIYKEAALIGMFGSSYGILASRWVFAVEVSLSSVLAFIILLRYVRPTLAFLAALPTCFFSVILFYFSNYSYDGEVLALLSIAVLVHSTSGSRLLAILGGVAGGLAFLAKPTFLGLIPIIVLAALADMFVSRRLEDNAEHVPGVHHALIPYVAGFIAPCLAVLAYFSLEGAAGDFINKAFLLPRQSFPFQLGFVLWQDLPQRMLFWPNISGYLAALLVALLIIGVGRVSGLLGLGAAAALMLVLALRAWPSSITGLPTARQETILLVVLGVLLLLNVAALVVAVLARDEHRFEIVPPELPVIALGLQYVAQFNVAGVRYSYYGAFLTVPVALLSLRWVAGLATPLWHKGQIAIRVSSLAPALLGFSIAVAGVVVTHGSVFRDGARSELSAAFSTSRLSGLTSLPANTAQVDSLVATVESRTAPGDPILVMPDFPVLYFLTGRRNPTRIGWYETYQVTSAEAEQAVADMKRDPPKLVFLQTYDEGDFRRIGPKLDYEANTKLLPVYRYVIANYRLVDTVEDIQVYEPAPAAP